jgi:hypothetical protein
VKRSHTRQTRLESANMVAASILVFSVVLLVQFGISQWRSMWVTVAAQPLSSALQTSTGIPSEAIGAQHFDLLARASEELSSAPNKRNSWLREVRLYFRLIRGLEGLSAKSLPALSSWAKGELVTCSRYAAAVLDQRLNANLAYAADHRSL